MDYYNLKNTNMNKGLLIHIIVAVVSILTILYVLGGNSTDSADRTMIALFFLVSQGFCAAFCAAEEFYKKKS